MDFCNETTLALDTEATSDDQTETECGEAALIRRLRARELGAFEEMVRLHGAHLMAVARQYLPQDADAEDAVQEALLKAFTCFHQFKEESRLSTWLHRIVVNAALMNRRSRSRKREQLVGHDEMVGAVAVRASSDREDPSERVMHSPIQDARLVAEHMQQLPGCHRTVMELRLIQHRSNADAARELGVTPAALKTMLHRAKSRIHKSLAQDARLAHLIA